MKIIILLLSLLAELHFIHHLSKNRYEIWKKYIAMVEKVVTPYLPMQYTNYILLAILASPIIVFTYLFQWLFSHMLLGIPDLICQWLIVILCFGKDNPFYPELHHDNEHQSAIAHLVSMNRNLFTVSILYLLAGPMAILLYRLIEVCSSNEKFQPIASFLVAIITYLPARITALLYLLVGHFQSGINVFYQKKLYSLDETDLFLNEVVKLSFCADGSQLTFQLTDIVLKHALVLFMVVVSLLTIVSWL